MSDVSLSKARKTAKESAPTDAHFEKKTTDVQNLPVDMYISTWLAAHMPMDFWKDKLAGGVVPGTIVVIHESGDNGTVSGLDIDAGFPPGDRHTQ